MNKDGKEKCVEELKKEFTKMVNAINEIINVIMPKIEAKPKKVFTEEEKQLIRLLDNVKYVARDEDGTLSFFNGKPDKCHFVWEDDCCEYYFISNFLTSLPFNAIKWEDEEPTSREEILGE